MNPHQYKLPKTTKIYPTPKPVKLLARERALILSLYNRGKTPMQISCIMGIPVSQIREILKEKA